MQRVYQVLKARWLEVGACGNIPVMEMDARLRANRLLRLRSGQRKRHEETAQTNRHSTMIRLLVTRAPLFAVLWWILAEGRSDAWQFGCVAVAAASWSSLRFWPPAPSPIRLAGMVGFLRFFLWNSIRGGIQVASMALRGRAALQPALIVLPLTLPNNSARVLLVNTLSLMPGTVGVDMDDAGVQLHVLDSRLPVAAEVQALEAVIARLFGVSP